MEPTMKDQQVDELERRLNELVSKVDRLEIAVNVLSEVISKQHLIPKS